MASSVRSDGGHKMRLNVSAQHGSEDIKVLVVVDAEASLKELHSKIRKALQRRGVSEPIERLLNGQRAALPEDEYVGDMLHDGEEVCAVVRGSAPRTSSAVPAAAPGPADETLLPQGADAGKAVVTLDRQLDGGRRIMGTIIVQEEEEAEDEEAQEEEAAAPHGPREELYPGAMPPAEALPGPREDFLASASRPRESFVVDVPSQATQLQTYDNDWLVETFTPKLREHIMAHFQEDCVTEPTFVPSIGKFVAARFLQSSGSYVSVFLRPQTALGSDPSSTMPVHYNVSKTDILTFIRHCEEHVERVDRHLAKFGQSASGLQKLLASGHGEADAIDVVLPFSYEVFEEVEGVMLEADRPLLQNLRGSCPVVVVDTSGAVGKHLTYVKGGLKRALHSHLSACSAFQFVRMNERGEPRQWTQHMETPTDAAIQAAEEWIDGLAVGSNRGFVNAVRCALTQPGCDEVVILTSADFDRAAHNEILTAVRTLNLREVAIHTVGVDPEPVGENLLRNISESNHGDFALRTFDPCKLEAKDKDTGVCSRDAQWRSWRTSLVNKKARQLSESFKKQKMSIGSQLQILEVMEREEQQRRRRWIEEIVCSQRLLDCQEAQRNYHAPDRDCVKELERRKARTNRERVGGGYVFKTEELDFGLESMFEQKSAVPWTLHSETTAAGPKVPRESTFSRDVATARVPKLPPSREQMAQAQGAVRDSEGGYRRQRSSRGHSAGRAPSGQRQSSTSSLDRTQRRPPSAQRRTAAPRSSSASRGRPASADRAAGGVPQPSEDEEMQTFVRHTLRTKEAPAPPASAGAPMPPPTPPQAFARAPDAAPVEESADA